MPMNTTEKTTYAPFVRQYKDWYTFQQRGSFFLNFRFKLASVDYQRISNTVNKLLQRREILRAVFELNAKGCLVYRLLPVHSPLLAPIYIDMPSSKATERLQQIEKDIEFTKLNEGPLFRCVVVTQGQPFLMVYVNHLIANARSVEVLKADFKQLYIGQVLPVTYSFNEFACNANKKLLKRYSSTFKHWQAVFNPIDPAIISQQDSKVPGLLTLEACHQQLSSEKYHIITTAPGARPMYYDKQWHINDFETVSTLLPKLNITWYSLLLTVFRYVVSNLNTQYSLIGLLFDYRYSKYAADNIGEFTGEAYIPIESVECTLQQIQHTNSWLIKSSAHLIFNYNLYHIHEPSLYRHCLGFFNFRRTPARFQDLSRFDNPGELDFLGFVLEPIMNLHPCGTLQAHWRFDANAIPVKQLVELDQHFGQTLQNTIATLQAQAVAQPC